MRAAVGRRRSPWRPAWAAVLAVWLVWGAVPRRAAAESGGYAGALAGIAGVALVGAWDVGLLTMDLVADVRGRPIDRGWAFVEFGTGLAHVGMGAGLLATYLSDEGAVGALALSMPLLGVGTWLGTHGAISAFGLRRTPRSVRPNRALEWTLVTTSGVLAGLATGFWISALTEQEAQLGSDTGFVSERKDRHAALAGVLSASSFALGVTGGILFLTAKRKPPRIGFSPLVLPEGGGLSLAGSW